MIQQKKKFISTLTALHCFQKAERLPGTSAQLETAFLSPLASGMTIRVVYVKEIRGKCGPFQASLSLEAAELLPQPLSPFDAWRQKSHRPSGNGGITTPKNPEGPGRNCALHKQEVKFYLTAKPMEI